MADTITADVVIVGSGIAGALLAAKLAAAGVKVAILEAGAAVDRTQAVETYWNALIKVPECPYPAVPEAMHPVSDDPDFWYRQTGPDKFRSTYVKVVGGTTWHWLGTCLRFVPNDFRLKSLYGHGADWPLAYDELEPFYGQAENEIGVAGDSDEPLGSPRSAPFPMPAIPPTYLDGAFTEALKGTRYDVRPTPQGRNSVFHDERAACCGNASCIPVCPVQAKYDATVHVDRAVAAGAALYEKTTAVALDLAPDRSIAAVRFKRWDGSEGTARAKVFVVAAHAVEGPRLLLASRSEAAPNGVANSSDQVGRNLMDHPIQLSWALAPKPVYPYRGPLSTSGIENLRDGTFRRERGAFRIEIGNDGWSWPTGAPITTAAEFAKKGLRGEALDAALRDQASRHIRLASLVEQLPDPENRVTLDPDERDMYGVPLPRIAFRLDDYVETAFAASVEAHDDIFARLGASEVQHSPQAQGAGHIIGTARMGDDPKTSVVNRDLRSHDHRNLFVLGSAVFPTSATANPTLTIAALSLRAVAAVKAALAG
ncbi:FAD dependent oxidoreductase [Ancylobacter novellus DSM 506]|uniref:FAD dependent oxidoreductase n=1 Tax=Ancylobacter novellus (strain ATCC 8093 / DSM 506 / JCM 20403 / CCM 1077 / IAM 12100 / NBRC 12443 / NCIMB 10456) TaxID=639283 RepID=D7A1B2_ANCN5|nr:GMC family oxidoreductase [Ancylobacter novellus]ADH89470.1 FAD dependent oxidoreductase [Ancylobacter novellus DSM 506]